MLCKVTIMEMYVYCPVRNESLNIILVNLESLSSELSNTPFRHKEGGEWAALCPLGIPGKYEAAIVISQEVGWAPKPVWMFWGGGQSLFPLSGIEPRFFNRHARSLVI
jgi:hypothetical protein